MHRFFYDTTIQVTAQGSKQANNHASKQATTQDSQSTISPLNQHLLGNTIALTETIVHHWCRVLRANIGDRGILFDGFGGEYVVELTHISKKHATASIKQHQTDDRSAPLTTCIGLVMSRGERMDYAIQKATELGVTAIQLLSSHHGEIHLKPTQIAKKLAHWQQVAIAACEQCGLNRPPLLLAPMAIDAWLTSQDHQTICKQNVSPIMQPLIEQPYYQRLQMPPTMQLMLAVPASNVNLPDQQQLLVAPTMLINTLTQPQPFIKLLIGAEGGLSAKECQLATQMGFLSWQIGTRVLRTETAPVVALATLHAIKQSSSHFMQVGTN